MYREAVRRNIIIKSIEVKAAGKFGMEGEPASNQVNIQSDTPKNEIIELIHHVDTVAEIHNTLRKGVKVSLQIEGWALEINDHLKNGVSIPKVQISSKQKIYVNEN